MIRLEKVILEIADKANWISAIAVFLMMMLTVLDVILRLFRSPIPGTYEIVGLLGALAISFALGYTSMEKGHIAVDFLMQKFSEKTRMAVSAVNDIIAMAFFSLAAWQSFLYAMSLMKAGEVSMTLQVPTWPFVCGIGAGCILLCLVLLVDFMRLLRGVNTE